MPTKFKSPRGTGPITGVLEFEDDILVVEFHEPRFLRKARDVKIDISAEEIDELRYRRGILKNTVLLRALYLDTLREIPWSKPLEATFVIPRREDERAFDLAERFEEYVSGSTADA